MYSGAVIPCSQIIEEAGENDKGGKGINGMGKRKTGDKQTHLNRYYAWRIIEAIATPPPKERRRLSSKEYAKISRKEIKEIFRYTISLLEKMGINSLDDVKF